MCATIWKQHACGCRWRSGGQSSSHRVIESSERCRRIRVRAGSTVPPGKMRSNSLEFGRMDGAGFRGCDRQAANCQSNKHQTETTVTGRRLVCAEPGAGKPRAMRPEGVYVPSTTRQPDRTPVNIGAFALLTHQPIAIIGRNECRFQKQRAFLGCFGKTRRQGCVRNRNSLAGP